MTVRTNQGRGVDVDGHLSADSATMTGARTAGQAAATQQDSIGGTTVLRGLILYAAIFAFAGIYVDFIVRILAAGNDQPRFDGALVSAAAALAGVLGSAFALRIGTTGTTLNPSLQQHILITADAVQTAQANALRDGGAPAAAQTRGPRLGLFLHRVLSIEPGRATDNSWPLTFGIWAYAIVASAVAITFVVHQSQTPSAIKALAVTFAGYVLALINSAYGLAKPSA